MALHEFQQFSELQGVVAQGSVSRRKFAEQIYRTRRLRSRFLPDSLFAEPAWDILLLLYGVEQRQERLTVSAVCDSADVPKSTALRWLAKLLEAGMIVREEHPCDRRVIWVRLSEETVARLDAYFAKALSTEFRCK